MKKLISGLMLFVFALTLTSCIEMSGQTTLSFKELPDAVIQDADGKGQLNPKEIVVLIDGKAYALDAAEKIGAIVEGDEYEEGYNTLLVTYNNVTISFTYLVEANPVLPEITNTAWYDEEQKLFELSTAAELRGLAELVNGGTTFEGKTVKLAADIDLAGYAWTPIGEGARKVQDGFEDGAPKYIDNSVATHTFQGTFDGQNFVISNLSDAGYVPVAADSYSNTTEQKVYGYAYGLFGMINAGGVTIKNVVLEDVQISGVAFVGSQAYVADSVAGIVGYCGVNTKANETITISNCHVSGAIAGYDCVAGIAGRLYSGIYVIEDCVNEANLTETRNVSGKCGGMAAYLSYCDGNSVSTDLTIKNSQNKGEINAPEQAYKSDYVAYWAGSCAYKCADDPNAPKA